MRGDSSIRSRSRPSEHQLCGGNCHPGTSAVAIMTTAELALQTAVSRSGSSLRSFLYSRSFIRVVQFGVDILSLAVAFAAAYALRFEFDMDLATRDGLLVQLPVFVTVELFALACGGVYAFIWRYVGLREARVLVGVFGAAAVPMVALRVLLPDSLHEYRTPLSVILMATVLGFGGILGLRVARRWLYESRERQRRSVGSDRALCVPTLLVGAGRAGVIAAREILGRGDVPLDIRGFVDDDPKKMGLVVNGLRVLGTTADLPKLVADLGIGQVVISIAQISRSHIRRIIGICNGIGVKVQTLPGLYEILQGKVQVTRIRNVQIEDLLGRQPVALDELLIGDFLAGRTVLITGAGGSIGRELSRQVARFGPSVLLLMERAEFALFDIEQELRRRHPGLTIVPLVVDVRDRKRLHAIFAEHRPQVVFHAAAHKHVSMMETNPAEAIKNNIFGTQTVAEEAGKAGAEAFVLISTDKAVRPTSVMGASKRIAELVVQDLERRYSTRYVAVRFGNVIGSAGSVVPIFREQIGRGGPVTVTHADMTRYFMTIPEAAQLVLQAGAMGQGGEIFVLDMGAPVRILDLAIAMITLSGLEPFDEIEIAFTGLRPGEKLHEELSLFGEEIGKTKHPKIFIGNLQPYPAESVSAALARLQQLATKADGSKIRRFFNEFLPEANLGVRREELRSVRKSEIDAPEPVGAVDELPGDSEGRRGRGRGRVQQVEDFTVLPDREVVQEGTVLSDGLGPDAAGSRQEILGPDGRDVVLQLGEVGGEHRASPQLRGAGSPVARDEPPKSGPCHGVPEVSGRPAPSVVRFPAEAQDGVRARRHYSVLMAGEMDAKEGKPRIRHRRDHRPDEMARLGAKRSILASERNDPKSRISGHRGDPIALEPGAGEHSPRLDPIG
jgi:FlaA1/EpsC-like NDP-sugar epimerase